MSCEHTLRPCAALVLFLIMFSGAGWAQTRRHDISVSYGVGSGDQLLDAFEDVLTIVLTFGTYAKEHLTSSGVPFLAYHYSANSRFGFGAAVGGYNTSGTLQIVGEDAGTFKETNTIVAAELDYRWVMKKGFQLYSGIGVGIRVRKGTYQTSETETDSQILPTFHLNAIGLRFGRKVGVFVEAGAGYKGLLSAGLNAQF